MSRALVTDLYELRMAASYLKRGMTAPATFSLFVRDLPEKWGFLVSCGLESCLDFLETFRFEQEDLDYLGGELGYQEDTLEAFSQLRFTGDVRAIPEGRLFEAQEPMLEVTAPLPEAQIVETFLLNQVTYQTAVASKAARCRIAAPDASLVDFSLRRVHGNEAGLGVARATAIAGFSATSNVEAARMLGLRAAGTMAHSYVEAFPREIDSFRAFAEDFPERVVLLVDTYDTERGVANAIKVAREIEPSGRRVAGIRLDSGDLAVLARKARTALDEAGMTDIEIFASGGLDEYRLAELTEAGAPIDAYGVGTKIGVAEDAPALDSVYKLVEYAGRPVSKLSTSKRTLPGPKQVWRASGMSGDVIGLASEEGPSGWEPMLVDVMREGRREEAGSHEEAAGRFAAELEGLPQSLRSLAPSGYPVEISEPLRRLSAEVASEIERRELGW
ncbi:MAG: nicotinate phosphoribosyltransferase [Actinomycetota bacterium]